MYSNITQKSNYTACVPLNQTFFVINTVQSIFIILLNLPLFVFILSRRPLRTKTPNQFFSHLQMIHITIGLLRGVGLYKISSDIVSNVILISMFVSLLLTSADRLVALKFPLKYKLATSKGVIRILAISWLPAICFIIVVKVKGVDSNQLKLGHTITIGFASIILMTTNIMIYTIAKKHHKFVRQNSYLRYRREQKNEKSMKATYLCIAVVLNFILFWMPHCVHDTVELTSIISRPNHTNAADIIVGQLTPLNSLTDPILFISLSSRTQVELRKLFRLGSALERQATGSFSSTASPSITRF